MTLQDSLQRVLGSAFAIERELSRHPAATVTPFALLVPVAGILGSTLILGEAMHPIEAVGGAIIVLGLAFNVFGPRLMGRRAA